MGASAVLIVPPFLKVVSGPLLGPALLMGAGRQAGHQVALLDLNACWLRDKLPVAPPSAISPFVGDHDRPSELLRSMQREFWKTCQGRQPGCAGDQFDTDDTESLTLDHHAVLELAKHLGHSSLGRWVREHLAATSPPDVVGLSVMYSGQVLAALVVSLAVRNVWPRAVIVWGGAHVTTLRDAIAADGRYGACVDHFVFGYAERTWVEILDAVAARQRLPAEAVPAGAGRHDSAKDDPTTLPAFDDIDSYGWGRLTLPAQASRGCAYGRCAFCTYPAVEGAYRPLPLGPVLEIVGQAEKLGAAVSFKDSLVVPKSLETIANTIQGRVSWSACTKLNATLDASFLGRLAAAGCATLEFGLETLAPDGQLIIDKRQALPLLHQTLDAAEAAGIAVVVNYMTGLPGVDAAEEARWLDRVRWELKIRPNLVSKIEHNEFQLERMSPMGRSPADFGLQITATWPWSAVMAWELASEPATNATTLPMLRRSRLPRCPRARVNRHRRRLLPVLR